MPADIELDAPSVDHIAFTATDIHLAHAPYQRDPGTRRALVHEADDALAINFNFDYPGGTRIYGSVNIAGPLNVESAIVGGWELTEKLSEILGRLLAVERRLSRLEQP